MNGVFDQSTDRSLLRMDVFCVITLSSSTSSPALTSRGIRLLMNQLNHRMPLFNPIILMVSFSLASFSYTTLFRMIATEYIQARVMKRGMERLITRRKLRQRTRLGLESEG